ncbi:hypothetical protein LJC63_04060 [Ruminococcaceae bacterium OttesenSCG-928-L11]|nr:hypothetical protein [Ruminococcaceae bacterium OttesenSCG-928-L11]
MIILAQIPRLVKGMHGVSQFVHKLEVKDFDDKREFAYMQFMQVLELIKSL